MLLYFYKKPLRLYGQVCEYSTPKLSINPSNFSTNLSIGGSLAGTTPVPFTASIPILQALVVNQGGHSDLVWRIRRPQSRRGHITVGTSFRHQQAVLLEAKDFDLRTFLLSQLQGSFT